MEVADLVAKVRFTCEHARPLGLCTACSHAMKVHQVPAAWECPRCRRVNAPHVRYCDCPAEAVTSFADTRGTFAEVQCGVQGPVEDVYRACASWAASGSEVPEGVPERCAGCGAYTLRQDGTCFECDPRTAR